MGFFKIFSNINSKLASSVAFESKRTRILLLISIYLVTFSILMTIIGQLPFFSTRGITQLFQLCWVIVIIPVTMLSYRYFIRSFISLFCVLFPFLLYLLIAALFKVNSFSYQGTTLILLSFYLFLIGRCLSPYFNKTILKLFAFFYLLPVILYAIVVYFDKLRGVDISGSIYAVSSKNSTGPILIIGAFCSLIIFDKNTIVNIFFKIVIFSFLIFLVALMKCRTVLLSLPICFFVFVFFIFKNIYFKIGFLLLFVFLVLIVIFIPSLNQTIIHDVLLNGKTNIDDIFSGRISQTINAYKSFKPIMGSGNSYIDCMPLSFLATYGIVGFLSLLIFSILPVVALFSFIGDKNKDKNKRLFYTLLLVMFIFQYLFEGFGYFGPGAKAFILWLIAGSESKLLFKDSKSKLFVLVDSFSIRLSSYIKPFSFSMFIGSSLIVIAVFSYIPGLFSNHLAELIYSKIPSSAVVTDYKPAKNVLAYSDFINESGVFPMCKGQTIKVKFKADNECYDDIYGFISDHDERQKEFLSINAETCEVTAVSNYAWTVFQYYVLRDQSPKSIYVSISKSVDEYQFNKLMISTNQFKESFEYTNDERIRLGVNSSNKVYYDTYYVPKDVKVYFYSSNPNIASVDKETGDIVGVAVGQCEIYATIVNDAGTFLSNNRLIIDVDDDFIPCTSMKIEADKCYRYIPYNIETVFNSAASDTGVICDVKGLSYHYYGKSVVFEESGLATITVTSISNPNLHQTLEINVIDNHPVSFSTPMKMLQVGNIYRPVDIRLSINYSSGHSLIVSDDALAFSQTDRTGRAWYETNGKVIDHCSFKAVKTGEYNLSLISRYDKNIEAYIHFDIIKYTTNEYRTIISSILLVLILLFNTMSQLFIVLINFKSNRAYCFLNFALIALFSTLSLFAFGLTKYSLICCFINIILGIITFCFRYIFIRNKMPHLFDDYVPLDDLNEGANANKDF